MGLVQPRWKGKYAALQLGPAQGSTAMTYVYHHPQLGPKFIERIYRDLEPTMFRDLRQGVDWLSQGKYPLCFLCRRIDRAAIQGLPVAELNPYQVEEKPGLGSGSGAVVLMNQHPNPSAAKVFINWLLSQEGQTAFLQANTDEWRIGSLTRGPAAGNHTAARPATKRQGVPHDQSSRVDGFQADLQPYRRDAQGQIARRGTYASREGKFNRKERRKHKG